MIRTIGLHGVVVGWFLVGDLLLGSTRELVKSTREVTTTNSFGNDQRIPKVPGQRLGWHGTLKVLEFDWNCRRKSGTMLHLAHVGWRRAGSGRHGETRYLFLIFSHTWYHYSNWLSFCEVLKQQPVVSAASLQRQCRRLFEVSRVNFRARLSSEPGQFAFFFMLSFGTLDSHCTFHTKRGASWEGTFI